MNKKIISLLMGAAMLASAMPAMATTEGIVQDDIMLISEEPVVEEKTGPSYYRHIGTVATVGEASIDVVVEGDMVVTFAVTDTTAIYTIEGEEAEAVAEGDMVIVASTSPLMSRDIKEATAIVITNEESQTAVYVDTFNMTEEGLLSADGELVLNMENADEYEGKKLLVFYDFATMSLPAQTNPTKVVVLEDVMAEETEKVTISFNVGSSIININGTEVEVETPYIVGVGVTLVPMRVISESFGAEVNWDGETKTVTVVDGETTIVVTIGSKTATVNGEEKELEEAPELTENGFTMIPLRFISENLGAEVGYIHETQAISVER